MDKMREEFEAWAKTSSLKNFLFWNHSDNQYEVHAVQMAFEGWKASGAALRVKLLSAWYQDVEGYILNREDDVKSSLDDVGVRYE